MKFKLKKSLSLRTQYFTLAVSLAAVMLSFIAAGLIAYLNTRTLADNSAKLTRIQETISAARMIELLVISAETGQRGFVLTGKERYLEPYNAAIFAIDEQVAKILELTRDNPLQQERIPSLSGYITLKIKEIAETIELRRTKGFETALEVLQSDRGKVAMEQIRARVRALEETERALQADRIDEAETAYQTAVVSGAATGLLGLMISAVVAYLVLKESRLRQRQDWLRSGQVGLAEAVVGEIGLDQLGDQVLKFLTNYLGAHSGAIFGLEDGQFRRLAAYGVPNPESLPTSFDKNDGLLGRAEKDQKTFVVRNIPDGYLRVGSALGESVPRHLVIAPAMSDSIVNVVYELGFLDPIEEPTIELLDKISPAIGAAIQSANFSRNRQLFLEETQRQSEELQVQSEELRVSNEELEEQSRALKESQSRLEQQQVELEQINNQLNEQSTLLTVERDTLSKTKVVLQSQAKELEASSQLKSDFLANMSHELRTPLNSSLILAKLLADNVDGNLTEEQVKYAQTIQSAGNDLLLLINDILDLSKIEAGHMQLRVEQIDTTKVADGLRRIFEPIAADRKIQFVVNIAPNAPESIQTDHQRLSQILKNLLSNAMKFTQQGSVELSVGTSESGKVYFSVKDTGIGIAPEQQEVVFDAFRQADGTINRKFGGTGLGLSISRELARLLGGDISLQSSLEQGSTFTLLLPRTTIVAALQGKVTQPLIVPSPEARDMPLASASAASSTSSHIADDRNRPVGEKNRILVVEDDESFARILLELAHELDLNCLIATSAEEALVLALQYLPSAVVLDIGLPDYSGLAVLDRLKHDARTRHIPVHVISGGDHAQRAFELGAVGYLLKPVQRKELIEALKGLETRLEQRMRRVLVVEDDLVQLDSLRKLLGSHAVETQGAATAAECLAALKDSTFDCMVLDLALPDASGYELLETLSREESYSFPPVIVYTGRELSLDEEEKLRRYSKSIIIKGAKSPERLLDEVTLFLHQVVSDLPPEQQKMLERAKKRDAALEGRCILIVEDDVRNVFALTSILEPRGALIQIARNGREALAALDRSLEPNGQKISLVLMDVMMPEMDGITATKEIRKRSEFKGLPVIMLTAKAMKDDHEQCLRAGASDYMAKPLDIEKLLSLVRVWIPR